MARLSCASGSGSWQPCVDPRRWRILRLMHYGGPSPAVRTSFGVVLRSCALEPYPLRSRALLPAAEATSRPFYVSGLGSALVGGELGVLGVFAGLLFPFCSMFGPPGFGLGSPLFCSVRAPPRKASNIVHYMNLLTIKPCVGFI